MRTLQAVPHTSLPVAHLHRPFRRGVTFLGAVCFFLVVGTFVVIQLGQVQPLFASTRSSLTQTRSSTPSLTQSGSHTTAAPSVNASQQLVRIDQTVAGQEYNNDTALFNTWSPSTCSATSMAEVMNAYGHHYTIADVLKVESGLGEITPDLGLVEPSGIDKTAASFGFNTLTLSNPSVDEIVSIGNAGKPVIISFPPQTWAGGHILVVLGSTTVNGIVYVHLADSSRLDMQYMTRDRFLSYWRGFAKVLSPQVTTTSSTGNYSVVSKPTVTADFINQVLAAYGSPAAGKGQALYDLGIQYGIDPAFALAFFQHESTFGKFGEANTTRSLGNLRCIPNTACINSSGQTCAPGDSCYAAFPTWEAGFEAWYKLIRNLYVNQWGLSTIPQIIPKYAPSADNNDEAAYIASVEHSIDVWHSGQVLV